MANGHADRTKERGEEGKGGDFADGAKLSNGACTILKMLRSKGRLQIWKGVAASNKGKQPLTSWELKERLERRRPACFVGKKHTAGFFARKPEGMRMTEAEEL